MQLFFSVVPVVGVSSWVAVLSVFTQPTQEDVQLHTIGHTHGTLNFSNFKY